MNDPTLCMYIHIYIWEAGENFDPSSALWYSSKESCDNQASCTKHISAIFENYSLDFGMLECRIIV